MADVNDCWGALNWIFDERRGVVDEHAARDKGLIERGALVGLQRVIETSKVD